MFDSNMFNFVVVTPGADFSITRDSSVFTDWGRLLFASSLFNAVLKSFFIINTTKSNYTRFKLLTSIMSISLFRHFYPYIAL